MPNNVSDELAALRKRNLTKKLAGNLKDADGLSTPEQEEAVLQETNKTRRASTYQKEAAENVKAGATKGAVDQDLEFKRKQIAMKKEDKEKQKEASKTLQSFNVAKVAAPLLASTTTVDEKKVKESAKPETPSKVETVSTPDPAIIAETVPVLEDEEELDDVPELEDQQQQPVHISPPPSQALPPQKRIPNRAEKKAKKTMEKLGMKAVAGISRVTLKMSGGGNSFYTIFQPDVYEKNGTYIVFGEAQQGPGMGQQQKQYQQQAERAAKMLQTPAVTEMAASTSSTTISTNTGTSTQAEVVDETGLEAKDIDLVVGQAGVARSKAVAALRANNGDLVNAIMSLTT